MAASRLTIAAGCDDRLGLQPGSALCVARHFQAPVTAIVSGAVERAAAANKGLTKVAQLANVRENRQAERRLLVAEGATDDSAQASKTEVADTCQLRRGAGCVSVSIFRSGWGMPARAIALVAWLGSFFTGLMFITDAIGFIRIRIKTIYRKLSGKPDHPTVVRNRAGTKGEAKATVYGTETQPANSVVRQLERRPNAKDRPDTREDLAVGIFAAMLLRSLKWKMKHKRRRKLCVAILKLERLTCVLFWSCFTGGGVAFLYYHMHFAKMSSGVKLLMFPLRLIMLLLILQSIGVLISRLLRHMGITERLMVIRPQMEQRPSDVLYSGLTLHLIVGLLRLRRMIFCRRKGRERTHYSSPK